MLIAINKGDEIYLFFEIRENCGLYLVNIVIRMEFKNIRRLEYETETRSWSDFMAKAANGK
jgi:hypothetical protein